MGKLLSNLQDIMASTPLPFSKAIALGYYDGPTSGVVQSERNLTTYKFQLLAWDAGQDMRIFSMAPLSSQSFERLVNLLSQIQPPLWPLWVPIWNFPSQETANIVEREVERILGQADFPGLVVAMKSIMSEIVSVKVVMPNDFDRTEDWFAFLDLDK